MVTAPCNSVFIARDPKNGGRITGSLTLVVFRIPTGVRAWIEDVVVENSARGQGIGEALTRAALQQAAELGAKTVDLTSRPSREAANRLYQRVGFQLRQTNLYRYTLK
jgi:ribosomal protein S18 acetylase RimI-like enzyme